MNKTMKVASGMICGLAIGAAALAPAHAQMMDDDNMTGTMMMDSNMTTDGMMAPMATSGQVLRYYTDRAGYVTAMDVQTANGVRMVRFSPGMAQRLYTTYPMGGMADVFIVGSDDKGMMRYDVVGVGKTVPRAGYMTPYMTRDIDLLEAAPSMTIGAKEMTVKGAVTSIIPNDKGEIVGIVIDNETLVRVPRALRHASPTTVGIDRVAGIYKGSRITAVGYPEAPRYGALSAYKTRLAAETLVINGRSVGALGLPRIGKAAGKSLINTSIFGTESEEELAAMGMGYRLYNESGTMSSPAMMDNQMAPDSGMGM